METKETKLGGPWRDSDGNYHATTCITAPDSIHTERPTDTVDLVNTDRNTYEDICCSYDIIEDLRKTSCFRPEVLDVLKSVVDYAELCYISDAEDMGQMIVDNAEVIERHSFKAGYEKALADLRDAYKHKQVGCITSIFDLFTRNIEKL